MNIVAIGLLVLKLRPLITSSVDDVELLITTPGRGVDKSKMVIDFIKGLYNLDSPPIPFEQIQAAIQLLIDIVVAERKQHGWGIVTTAVNVLAAHATPAPLVAAPNN